MMCLHLTFPLPAILPALLLLETQVNQRRVGRRIKLCLHHRIAYDGNRRGKNVSGAPVDEEDYSSHTNGIIRLRYFRCGDPWFLVPCACYWLKLFCPHHPTPGRGMLPECCERLDLSWVLGHCWASGSSKIKHFFPTHCTFKYFLTSSRDTLKVVGYSIRSQMVS
jgi:hypothetical protein